MKYLSAYLLVATFPRRARKMLGLLPNLSQLGVLVLASYVAWILFKPYVVKSTIDNIPGPRSPSWLTGSDYSFDMHYL